MKPMRSASLAINLVEAVASGVVDVSPASLAEIRARVRLSGGEYAENTHNSFINGVAAFAAWCKEHDRGALPASIDTVTDYIDDLAETKKPATIRNRLWAVSRLHHGAGMSDPASSYEVVQRIRAMERRKGKASRGAYPLSSSEIDAMLAAAPLRRPIDRRNVAMVMAIRDALLKSCEVVALQVEDVSFMGDGSARLRVKTRWKEAEQYLSQPTTKMLTAYLRVSGNPRVGTLFRSRTGRKLQESDVRDAIQTMAKRVGIFSDLAISAQSIRIGMVRDLSDAGLDAASIKDAARWRTSTPVDRYTAPATVSTDAVAEYYRRAGEAA